MKPAMRSPIPILRIFDEEKAKEFYLRFLGFRLDWEHRFSDGMPLYMQVSFDRCVLHLSEHHGDCTPGGAVRIQTDNLTEYHQGLVAKKYPNALSKIEQTPWETEELSLHDPFGNRIIFYEESSERNQPL
ncbi:VOC family protein [Cohnella sp. CFH 77786]|nr:VOC family protein [Cohnella sp. CFH 77786]